jgi:dihydrolipoamide dehydrogenase
VAENSFDLIIIGAGPGGYVAAIRAAQLGMRVACVEKQFLGGVCLNIGCIPSKALLDTTEKLYEAKTKFAGEGIRVGDISIDLPTMMARKDKVVQTLTSGVGVLFRKNKVEHVRGSARITAPGVVAVSDGPTARDLRAPRILIATGSDSVSLPPLPFDGQHIISSTEALSLPRIPKRMVIVGAGAIGLELGSVWNRLGTQILVLELMDRILPTMDKEMTAQLQRLLEKQGMTFRLKSSAQSAKILPDNRVQLTWTSGTDSGTEECDVVLIAVGRKPCTTGLGLPELGITTDRKGFIQVDPHYQTNIPGIYAIGDVIGGAMLAHKASEEGIAAVETMTGHAGHVNYRAVANIVYTAPELASVGLSEEEAKEQGHELRIGKFPFTANGRARGMDATEGSVKVIADARTDRLLGMHILAAHASDMIAEGALAMEFAASAEDIARTVHAHPTLPEAVKEAALGVERRTIHL